MMIGKGLAIVLVCQWLDYSVFHLISTDSVMLNWEKLDSIRDIEPILKIIRYGTHYIAL